MPKLRHPPLPHNAGKASPSPTPSLRRGKRLTPIGKTKNVVSVKGGCIEGLDYSKAIHIWTQNAMVPIPEGAESHSQESPRTPYGSDHEMLDQPGPLAGSGYCNDSPDSYGESLEL